MTNEQKLAGQKALPFPRVLGLAGSPRRGGNTETLLDRFLAGAESAGAQTKKIVVSRLKLAGCVACDQCFKNGLCAIQDDFQPVMEALIAADVIALAAPLFVWNLPAQTKLLVDRCQCQWSRKYILKAPLGPTLAGRTRRRGVFMSTAGNPEADYGGTFQTVEAFFSFWEASHWADLCFSDVDEKGAIDDHPEGLKQAFALGARAVSVPEDAEQPAPLL